MGMTLQGVGALAAGTTQGFQNQRKDNRAQADENRKQEQYQLEMTFRDIFAEREKIDQPDPPQAVPTGPPGAQHGALPDDPNTLGTMTVRGAPASTRRDKYQAWKEQASAAAVRAGGLQGIEAFNRMENELSRQQIMGYGLEAVRALNGGSAGEAAKLANTALEASPNDTGLEYFAMDGELYMQGQDGEPSGPLGVDHLRVLVEDYMKTPESFLAWQAQLEDERKNVAAEEDRDAQIAVNQGQLGVQQGRLAIEEDMVPANKARIGAQIYNLIQTADAATNRAKADDTQGLTPGMIRNINNDIPTLIQNAKLDPGSQWWGAMTKNPTVASQMQSSAIDTAKMNLMEGGNYADAIGLAAFALAPAADIEPPANARIGGVGIEGEGPNARQYAMWNGKKIYIPPTVYQVLNMQADALSGAGVLQE